MINERGGILAKYDCVAVGNDLYALILALFLLKKMRKVLVIQDSPFEDEGFEEVQLSSSNSNFKINYNRHNLFCGLNKTGLLYEYLYDLDLIDLFRFSDIDSFNIVTDDQKIIKQANSLEGFKIYLIRKYPKIISEINKFFDDLHNHYLNYKQQYHNMLINKDYTLTSLMIEWGDYSLDSLLKKYFTDDRIIGDFCVNGFINNLPPKETNAYSFFSNYILGLEAGFQICDISYIDLCNEIVKKIKEIDKLAVINTKITEYVVKDNNIEYLVDENKNLIQSKYFFISTKSIEFYKKNFKNKDRDFEIIKSYFPNVVPNKWINTLYLVVSSNQLDLKDQKSIFYFKNKENSGLKLLRLYNNPNEEQVLYLDFSYDSSVEVEEKLVLEELNKYIPKIKKYVVSTKLGTPEEYRYNLREARLRKNLSINELIDVESLEHIQVFANLYVGGEFIRPESGFFGKVNQSIIFADKIEDLLYFGDNRKEITSFTNDEVIMMIRHNYVEHLMGNNEYHINFTIGKNKYFFRTKGKNIVVHHGEYDNPDLSLFTTNQILTNLLLKKVRFQKVLESGTFKYEGEQKVLETFITAFQLDDYQVEPDEDYIISKHKFLGVKFFFAHIIIYALAAYFSNFYQNIYIFPVALLFTVVISLIKIKYFERINWVEIVFSVSLLIFTVLAILSSEFKNMFNDDIFLGTVITILLFSVVINQPVVYYYHQYDVSVDYRRTKLFKIINNGLTFLWAFIFVIILGGTFLIGRAYLAMFYSFLLFGILLTYFYPLTYIRTSIKK